jgi:hypothetical protein
MCAEVVGRDAELRATARFLDSLAGHPQALVLEGEPGIGKTTLWLAAVEQARQRGFRVLLCRPAAAEAQLSYASLADLLADVGDPVLESLPQPQRRAIDFVLLRAEAEPAVADYRATGAALLSVVERLADEMPVLLAIDDLQWLDGSSARVVEFALRRLASRAGLLGALRSAEGGDRGLSLPFPDPARVSRVRVGPLSLGALHQMLRQRIGRSFPRPVLARIEQVSGGNPFYALRLTGESAGGAEELGDPGLLAQALAASVMIRFLIGHGLDELMLQRALDLEDPDIPTPVMLRPALIRSLLLAWTGHLDQAREGLLSIRQRCLERGEESDLMFAAFHHVIVECWRGNLADARLIAEDTLERALQLGTAFLLAIALATQANVAAYAGQPDETRGVLVAEPVCRRPGGL